jgi:hypothetical protein
MTLEARKALEVDFDDIPMERVVFDASTNVVTFEVDTALEERVRIKFQGVTSISYRPTENYQMDMFCVNERFSVALYELLDSSSEVRRYCLPTLEGVWEIASQKEPVLM